MQREDVKMLVKKWRDIYEDESLDYKINNTKEEAEKVTIEPFVANSLTDGVEHKLSAPSAA